MMLRKIRSEYRVSKPNRDHGDGSTVVYSDEIKLSLLHCNPSLETHSSTHGYFYTIRSDTDSRYCPAIPGPLTQ
eukprot:746850-Hanusia_phi.AAC.1